MSQLILEVKTINKAKIVPLDLIAYFWAKIPIP